ncbi:MAG: D-alanine--D-alanine ligase [Deltaproteobacteria bacterium]|nr:D-alanine--D-alanine ligase [Deltaproteobacteria bacterium]
MSGASSDPTSLHVAVLHGGPSSEHDISVVTSRGVLAALRARGHRADAVWVDRNGRWHLGGGETDSGVAQGAGLDLPAALGALVRGGYDVCFLGFHGTFGEDGRVQAALELAGLRFTGSGPLASAVAMDKVMTRRVFRATGLPVADGIELVSAELATAEARAAVAADAVATVGLPAVVKVVAGGSSVGVEIAKDLADTEAALDRLRTLWPTLLIERFVGGTELTCGVLDGPDGPTALPCVEIAPRGERFFDYETKYDPSLVDEIVPARIPAAAEAALRSHALAAHRVLGCRGVSRTDAILDRDGALWLLETNTLPGLTPASLLPKAAAAAGLPYADLLERIIANALADG